MVIAAVFEQALRAFNGAALRLGRTINQALDAGMYQRAYAHGAGFQRDIERATWESVISQLLRRGTQGYDLGMRAGIVCTNGLIMPGGYEFPAFIDKYCANRHFIFVSGEAGLGERLLHPGDIAYSHSMVPGGLPEIS